jgi:hypothetical protein
MAQAYRTFPASGGRQVIAKRVIPVGVLCLFSFLLAACMTQQQTAQPDSTAVILSEIRNMRAQVEQIKNAGVVGAVASYGSPSAATPLDESSQIESITYTRDSGRIRVIYSPKNPPVSNVTTATAAHR